MREKPFLQIVIIVTGSLTYFLSYWLDLLVSEGNIIGSVRIIILLIVGLIYLAASLLIKFDKSLSVHEANERKEIFTMFLEHLHAVYLETWFQDNPNQIGPSVRINIMLVTRSNSLHVKNRKYLKMYYSFSVGNSYPDREQELPWFTGEGNCGRAWKDQETKTWIKNKPEYNQDTMLLTKKQKKITKKYIAVISIPLIKEKQVVGVINLDCNNKDDDPQFASNRIKLLLCDEAQKLEKIIEGPIRGKSCTRNINNEKTET